MAQLNLRDIPEDLVRMLRISAAGNGRTLKDECILRLQFSFEHLGFLNPPQRIEKKP